MNYAKGEYLHLMRLWRLALLALLPIGCGQDPTTGLATAPPVPALRVPEQLDDGWRVGAPEGVGLDVETLTQLAHQVRRGRYGQMHGMLIVRRGRLVFEEYYPGYHEASTRALAGDARATTDKEVPTARTASPHTLQSVTKSVTALLVGVAVDDGFIQGAEQPIRPFLPDYDQLFDADPAKNEIKLRHLLTMSAGLDWDEHVVPYTDPTNILRRMNASDDWARFVLEVPMADAPGARFEYCSGCSILLSSILQYATRLRVDEFAARRLFGPLGIQEYWWYRHPTHRDSLVHTGGGLYLRPRDLAKIGYLILSHGMWDGAQVVGASWIEAVSTPWIENSVGEQYGFQWWLRRLRAVSSPQSNDVVHGWGYGGQFVFAIPRLDMVIVFNAGDFEGGGAPFDLLSAITGTAR